MTSADDSAERERVTLIIREELARQRLSRAGLAARARISLSSLEKALAGLRPLTMQSLVRLEDALGVPLRRSPGESAIAPERLGSYARPAVNWLAGSYFTIRPSLSDAAAVYAYRTEIAWDEAKSHLVFTEHDRVDTPFSQFGDVSIPHQSGYIYLVTNRQGQYRLAILARPNIEGELYGLLATLQAVRGAHLMPLSTPLPCCRWGKCRRPLSARFRLANCTMNAGAAISPRRRSTASSCRQHRRRERSRPMSRSLVIIGLTIAAVGILWPWISKLGLGRLPGDILIQREGFTFYMPITTGILVSLVASGLVWLINR